MKANVHRELGLMHSENVVDELLAEWELSRRNGRELSAAELCHECPELVSVLEERISALKSTDWLFGISSVVENAESCDATPPRCIGEYEILDRIGAGGMGTVYRARHRRLHKLIALKILPKTAEWNRTAIARFERETRAIGRLENPHIVAAYDAGESDGVHYLAMQLLDGADVGWIAQYEALTVAQACEIVRQAAVGLSAAHINGLVHRDVKPSNLMLGRDGVVRVLDLGLARLVDLQDSEQKDISSSGQAMGTMDYMAPEQFDDSSTADHRADIYGLGATLFRLLCGSTPLEKAGRSRLRKMQALAAGDIASVSDQRPDLPAELIDLINHLLSAAPEDRPATAADVSEKLLPFCGGGDLRSLAEALPQQTADTQSETLPAAAGMATPHILTGPKAALPSTVTPESATQPETLSSGSTGSRRRTMIALALGAPLLLLLASIIYIKTDHGMLVVDAREGVTVELLEDSGVRLVHQRTGQEFALRVGETTQDSGEYAIRVREEASGLEFSTKELRIGRGKTTELVVTLDLPPSTGPPMKDSPPQTLGTDTERTDRDVAMEVLELGGHVVCEDQSGQLSNRITNARQLPEGPLKLVEVNLGGLPLANDAFSFLHGREHLRILDVQRTNCTAVHFRNLPVLPALEKLGCYGCLRLDDECLKEICRQKLLRDLHLHHTHVTNRGIAQLKELPKLRWLFLNDTSVGDEVVADVATLKSLERVYLCRCRITSSGLDRLHELLPACTILHDSGEILPQRPPASQILAVADPVLLSLVGESKDWTWTEPKPLNAVNSPLNDSQPELSPDGLTLWFHRMGNNESSIYVTQRSSLDDDFSQPISLSSTINARSAISPSVTDDELELFFVSARSGGLGNTDIWYATRQQASSDFENAQPLGAEVNSVVGEVNPIVSGNGLALIFSAVGPVSYGGMGGTDLFETRRTGRSKPFGKAMNLGNVVNSEFSDSGAWLASDGCVLVISSGRHSDLGRDQLYLTTRKSPDDPFHEPIRLAAPFTTYEWNGGFAADAKFQIVVFASKRPGSAGNGDLWITRRIPKP